MGWEKEIKNQAQNTYRITINSADGTNLNGTRSVRVGFHGNLNPNIDPNVKECLVGLREAYIGNGDVAPTDGGDWSGFKVYWDILSLHNLSTEDNGSRPGCIGIIPNEKILGVSGTITAIGGNINGGDGGTYGIKSALPFGREVIISFETLTGADPAWGTDVWTIVLDIVLVPNEPKCSC